jgi:hypothetical protein
MEKLENLMRNETSRRRSPGSRTFLDIIRGRRGSVDDDTVDPSTFVYSCFLMGEDSGYPPTWKRGELHAADGSVTWRRSRTGSKTSIPTPLRVFEVCDVTGPAGIKMKAESFKIVRGETSLGTTIGLGVPFLTWLEFGSS